MFPLRLVSLAAFLTLFPAVRAVADPVTLTFENIGNGELIGGFYNGGLGGNFGITFDMAAVALVDSDVGGGGFIANEPSPSTVLFFPTAGAAYVNVEGGFQNEVALFYSQPRDPTQPHVVWSQFSLAVFEGLGGTGRELGRWTLTSTDAFAVGDPTGGLFGSFTQFRGTFGGTGRSFGFFEARNTTGAVFDNLQFELAAQPIPEPTTLALLMGGGLISVGAIRRSRRH
jgi:hypothetical protein